ncbi:FAD-dependent monooxygenase [soil metagenome]
MVTGRAFSPDGRSDVLVIGAGPTGLVLAAQLHAAGASVRIIDRQADRVHESRALAVQARTLEVLSGLGISESLLERGNDAAELCMHRGTRVARIRLFDIGIDDTAFPFLLFISQARTEAVLNEHLTASGVSVERGVELVGFEAGEEDVTCTLRHGGRKELVRARFLVGCDGANSTVRRGAGIPFEGGDYPQTFALGDVEVDGDLQSDAVHVWPGALGMLFFFPLGEPATWRMMGMSRAGAESDGDRGIGAPSIEALQAICDSHTGGSLKLRDPAWLTYFRLRHRQAARYREGRVFLAGDAAHVHSPAGAQGMNTGIQDAWNLGWKLALVARGAAGETLLDSYDAERRPVGRFVVSFSDRAFSIGTSTKPLIRFLRARAAPRLAPLVLHSRRGRAFAFRTISQLGIHYRGSPLAEERRPELRAGPRAGDRLPDARIARDGESCRLQEVLGAPTFHLLLCGPPDAWPAPQLSSLSDRFAGLLSVHELAPGAAPGVLHDTRGEAFARLGVKEAAHILVRPDGYIGFRAGGTDLRSLDAYLARWLPAGRP